MLDQLSGHSGLPVAECHERHRLLAEDRVGLPDDRGPAQLIRRATEEHGRLDLLVNNVGAVRMRLDGFFGTSDEDFAWAMQMNFFIALRASRAALTTMVAQHPASPGAAA